MSSKTPEESDRPQKPEPKIELAQAFMPVLITSNFDDDLIKNKHAAWTHHFPIK